MVIVEDLNISFPNKGGICQVVQNVSFCVQQEKLALIGGSGSGKTMTVKALFGLVPKPGIVTAKKLSVFDHDILTVTAVELRKIRGKQIAMIMQDPKFSLNPVLTVGSQINECFRLHQNASNKLAKSLTLDILQEVKIQDPIKVYNSYPFQLSGGMGQRVMIAIMLACGPKLLVADEATSALDRQTRDEVLELIANICKARNMGLLMISHDLSLVANYCDRVLVMYNSKIVDSCAATKLKASTHPYTQGLLNCMTSLEKKGQKLFELSYANNGLSQL